MPQIELFNETMYWALICIFTHEGTNHQKHVSLHESEEKAKKSACDVCRKHRWPDSMMLRGDDSLDELWLEIQDSLGFDEWVFVQLVEAPNAVA